MRIKGSDLKRIIKEEISRMNNLSESRGSFLGRRRESIYGNPMSPWARNPTPTGDPLEYEKDMDQEGSKYERPSPMMRTAGKIAKLSGPEFDIMSPSGTSFNGLVASSFVGSEDMSISGAIIGDRSRQIGIYEVERPGEDGMVKANVTLFPAGKSKEHVGEAFGSSYWNAIGRAMGL